MNLVKLDLFIQGMVHLYWVLCSCLLNWRGKEEMLSLALQQFPVAYLNYQRDELLRLGGGRGKIAERVDSLLNLKLQEYIDPGWEMRMKPFSFKISFFKLMFWSCWLPVPWNTSLLKLSLIFSSKLFCNSVVILRFGLLIHQLHRNLDCMCSWPRLCQNPKHTILGCWTYHISFQFSW